MKAYRFDFSSGISDLASRTVAGGYSSVLDGVTFRDGGIAAGCVPGYWKNPLASDVMRASDYDTYMWSYRRRFYTSSVRRDYIGEMWGSREHVYFSEYGGVPKKVVNGLSVDLGQERPMDPPIVSESSGVLGDNLEASVILPMVGSVESASYTDAEIDAAVKQWVFANTLSLGITHSIYWVYWSINVNGTIHLKLLAPTSYGFGTNGIKELDITYQQIVTYLPSRGNDNTETKSLKNASGTLAPGVYGYRIAPIVKGVIGRPGPTVRITVPTLQDVFGSSAPDQSYSTAFAVQLSWPYSKYVDGYAIFGRTEEKETLLAKVGNNIAGWIDYGTIAETSITASSNDPKGDRPIQYIYTYIRNTNGHKDESGPSNPSVEVSGNGVRTITRPGIDGRQTTYGSTVVDVLPESISQTSPFEFQRYARLCAVDSSSSNGVVKLYIGTPSPGWSNPFISGDTVRFAGFKDSYWENASAKVISTEGETMYVGPGMPIPVDSSGSYGKIVFSESTPANFTLDAATLLCQQLDLTGKLTKNHTITIDNTLIGRPWGCARIRRVFSEASAFGITFISASPFGAGFILNNTTDPPLAGGAKGPGVSVIELMHDFDTYAIRPCYINGTVEAGLLHAATSIAGQSSIFSCVAYKPETVISNVPGIADGDTVFVMFKNGTKTVLRGSFKVYQIAGDATANRIRIAALPDNASVETSPYSFTPGEITSASITVYPKTNGVTHWRIYRVGDVTQWSFVAELPIDVDSYLDLVPASTLGGPPSSAYEQDGIQVIFDKPVQGMTDLTKHAGMYFGVVGNTLRWTPVGKPDAWPKTFMSNQFNYRPLRLMSYGGAIFIFCEDGVYRGEGSRPTTMTFSKTSAVDGCVAPRTVCLTSRGIVYLSRRGLVIFNGVSSQPILEGRISPSFLMSPDAIQPGIRYWIMPTLQGHFYAVASSRDGIRGVDQSGQRDVQAINQGVTHDILGVFHGGVYYLTYRGPNYMSHTIFTVNLEHAKMPCATLPYRVLDAHVAETGDLYWLVDGQGEFDKPDTAALAEHRYLGSSFAEDYVDLRGIMRVGAPACASISATVRTGNDDFGYPNIEKIYNYIDVYGNGAFTLRIFVDGEYIGSASGVACQNPNFDRRVNLPVGLKGQAINIEIAFEDTVKMLEYGYDLVESTDANPST